MQITSSRLRQSVYSQSFAHADRALIEPISGCFADKARCSRNHSHYHHSVYHFANAGSSLTLHRGGQSLHTLPANESELLSTQ